MGKIEYHGRVVPIVHYNSFEIELRRTLNISPTFPRFGSFEEWREKRIKNSTPTFTESKLDKLIQTLKSSGLDPFIEDVINLIGMYRNVIYCQRISVKVQRFSVLPVDKFWHNN